ncbi:hypothetical protein BDY24DRAFT_11211 [Mrakia frigida]|uniref:uncharacterized protein n=1 Tax=Mrakia frigida TaxID=29902 RepID=UPI003FCC06D1
MTSSNSLWLSSPLPSLPPFFCHPPSPLYLSTPPFPSRPTAPSPQPAGHTRIIMQPLTSRSSATPPSDLKDATPPRASRPNMSRSVSIAGQLKDVWDGYTGGGESGDRPDWMGSFTLLGECELFRLRDSGFEGEERRSSLLRR